MSTIVVTGAAGSVGFRVVQALAAGGEHEIVALDLKALPKALPGVTAHQVDLRLDDLKPLLEDAHVVVHLASAFGAQRDGLETAHVDLDAAKRLLDAASATGVQKLVVLSSAMVYGAWPDNPNPITEELPLRPNSGFSFGVVKAEVERLADAWQSTHPGSRLVILRPTVALAERQSSWVARTLRAAAVIEVAEQDPPLQFLHLDDLASAAVLAVTADMDGAYNVAPDGSVDGEVCRTLSGRTPRLRVPQHVADSLTRFGWRHRLSPTPPGMVPYCMYAWVVANGKLRSVGWEPTHTNEEAYVAGTAAKPWATMNAKRRQDLALGGAAVASAAAAAAANAAWRRFNR